MVIFLLPKKLPKLKHQKLNEIKISGAKGLVAFPNETLHATTFIQTLKKMHEKKKFHQMVIYIEACESGSMFKGLLPSNINIYGTTASNSTHSSVSHVPNLVHSDKMEIVYPI